MGACAGFNKNEGRGSRELKQGAKSKPRRESKLGVSMQSECINLMLQKIISNQTLTILLHKSIFIDLMSNFNHNYWSCDEKAALIRLLESYIKYSLSLICDQIHNDTKYKQHINFGEVFGLQMHKLENEVSMKSHWMLEILDFSEEYYQYNFRLEDTAQLLRVTNEVKVECEKDMLSMFYLSSYFVKACEKMEKQGRSIAQICEIMNKQATVLKEHYGAGAMKKKQQAIMIRADESQEAVKIQNFSLSEYKPIVFELNGNQNKEEQLQNQILQMVQLAKQCLSFFNSLLYQVCIESQGFGFKSNLKLNSRQNKSSLHRVKEKMLKKLIQLKAKPKQENEAIKNCKTIQQHLDVESSYVKSLMQQIYEQIDSIAFNVSDLLRGKCLFNKIAHINNAAHKIMANIKREKQNGKNVELVEIDNRLNGRTKDLVLKIKIEDLVCEFQLALFFKQAENEIDHKMYEMCRSKILSEVYLLYQWNKKSVHDYFSLINNVIQYVSGDRMLSVMQKFEKLRDFLALDEALLKAKEEYAHVDSAEAEILQNLKKLDINKEKMVNLIQGRKHRSLQYLIEQNREQKAIKLSEEDTTHSKDEYIIACQLNALGSAYKNLKKDKQALECYKKSLEIKERVKGSQSLDCAQTLNNIGLIYMGTEKYDEALESYKQSLQIKRQVKGENSIEFAQTLNNIGLIHDTRKDYDKALDYYNRSLLIKIIDKGSDSIDCAQALNNIGLVYNKKKKYAEAVDYLSRSLAIKEKLKGKNSMDCAQAFNNLGAVYRNMKSYQDALDYFERSLAIKKKVKGAGSIDYAQTLNNIGLVYQCESNFQKAIEYHSKALEIKEKIYGKQAAQCVSTSKQIKDLKIKLEGSKPEQQNDISKSMHQSNIKTEDDHQVEENKQNILSISQGGKDNTKKANTKPDYKQDIILEGLELGMNKQQRICII